MSFVTGLVSAPSHMRSTAVIESQNFNFVGPLTVTEDVALAAKGSRAERSSVRGHAVSSMAALVLSAAIALSPLANHQAKVIRQCIRHIHVVLCRWRNVDTPPASERTARTTAGSVPAGWVARSGPYAISISAATYFASPGEVVIAVPQ